MQHLLKTPNFTTAMLSKMMLILFMVLFVNNVNAQRDSNAINGKMYVVVKDNNATIIQDYSGNSATLSPEILAVQSRFGLTKISKPFARFSYLYCQKTYLFEFSKPDSILSFINFMNQQAYVKLAEKVPARYCFITPNDFHFNNGVLNATNWHLKKIGAESAWNLTTGTSSVIVAVIDNEIQLNHPDLMGKFWVNPLEIPGNLIDEDPPAGSSGLPALLDDVNGYDFGDGDANTSPNINLDHGTHVSGLIGANTNNISGVSSIGNNISIMALKAGINATGQLDPTAIINCFAYATWKQANIINCSFGGPSFSAVEAAACSTAIANGIAIVAAAGNDNNTLVKYPASYPLIIKVAATNSIDNKASFSNYDNTLVTPITICAPGTNIFSTNNTLKSTIFNGYDFKSGTSMASPIVAGLCGLMKSVNTTITPAQIKTCLMSTATNIDAVNNSLPTGSLGAGRINATQAVACAMGTNNTWFYANKTSNCIGGQIALFGLTNYNY
jgi:serine protease